MERLVAQVGLDTSTIPGDAARAKALIARGLSGVRKEAELAEKAIGRVTRGFQSSQNLNVGRLLSAGKAFDSVAQRSSLLRGSLFATTAAVGGLTAALGSNVAARYADSFTQINNQIRPLTKDAGELADRFNAIADISQSSRSGLKETATLYARIQKALPDLDVGKTLEVTQTIQKALQLGGATTQEAASAAIQFSQALASNRLGGEELRTILETPLGPALAKGLGVGLGEFRKLSTEGKLTASVLIDALGKIGPDVTRQFEQSTRTLDQAIVQADNLLTEYIGRTNDAYGATRILGDAIVGLANNLEFLGNIAGPVALGLGAVFAGRLAGGSAQSGVLSRVGEGARGIAAIASGKVASAAAEAARKNLENVNLEFGDSLKKLRELRALTPEQRAEQFAPDQVSAFDKNRNKLKSLDNERLKATEKLTKARLALADVSSASTPRIISQTNALAKAEQRVNELLVAQDRYRKFLKFSPNAEGVQAKLATVQAALLPARDKVSNVQAGLNKTLSARDLVLANERAAALKKVRDIEADIANIEAGRRSTIASARGAAFERDAAAAKGYAAAIEGLNDVTRDNFEKTTNAYLGVTRMERAMRLSGRAIATAKAAFSGLVGVLGGPFGAAITGLVVGLELYGLAAAKSAADTERVNKLIEELGVKSLSASEGVTKLSGAFKLNEARANLEALNKELEKTRGGFGSTSSFFGDLFNSNTLYDRQLEANFLKRQTAQFKFRGRGQAPIDVSGPDNKAAKDIERLLIELAKAPDKAEEVYKELGRIAELKLSGEMSGFVKRTAEAVDQTYKVQEAIKATQKTISSGAPSATPGFDDSLRKLRAEQATKEVGAQKIIENSAAIAAQTEQEKRLEDEIKKLREELADKGLEGVLSDDRIRSAAQGNLNSIDARSATALIKSFEGFRTNAYFDTDAFRVGYGSDTKTDLNGRVSRVTRSTTVTAAEADRDLARRVAEFQKVIRDQIGPATFDAMSENAKAALTSVAYNYGQLPANVAFAAKNGNQFDIAQSIRARSGDNNGLNRGRRNQEADLVLSGNANAESLDKERQAREDLAKASANRVRELEAEAAAVGKSVYERTLATEKLRLEQEATKEGNALTKEQSTEINRQAEAIAKAEANKAASEFKSESAQENEEKIAQLKREAEALGQTVYERERAARAQELLNKAKENGPVSSEEIARINALADAYGREAEAKAIAEFNDKSSETQKRKLEDLGLETEQIGKLATEQEKLAYIKERLRELDDADIPRTDDRIAQIYAEADAWAAVARSVEQQKYAQEQANEVRDEFKSDIKGFVTDIARGENAMDALTNALRRFADKLLDMSLDGLLDGLFGGGKAGGKGSGGGLLGGLFSSIFAGFFATGGQIPSGKFGVVGEGGGMKHAEIVSGPATVTPVSQIMQASAAMQARGPSGGGVIQVYVTPSDDLWATVDAKVEQMGGTAVRVAVAQSDRSSRKNFRSTSAEVSRRQG